MMGIVSISPKLPMLIGLVENLGLLGLLVVYKTTPRLILYFCILLLVTKIIPMATLWNIPIGPNDWKYMIYVFAIYLGWIYITGNWNVYSNIFNSFDRNHPDNLPGVWFIKSIVDKIENI